MAIPCTALTMWRLIQPIGIDEVSGQQLVDLRSLRENVRMIRSSASVEPKSPSTNLFRDSMIVMTRRDVAERGNTSAMIGRIYLDQPRSNKLMRDSSWRALGKSLFRAAIPQRYGGYSLSHSQERSSIHYASCFACRDRKLHLD